MDIRLKKQSFFNRARFVLAHKLEMPGKTGRNGD